MLIKIIGGYLAFMSLLSFILMCTDKVKAKRGSYRIPENTLLAAAVLGGAPGMWLAMILVRHKTKHLRFLLCAPFFTLAWGALLVFLVLH